MSTGWFASIALSKDGSQVAFVGSTTDATSKTSHLAVMPAGGGARRIPFEGEWTGPTRFTTLAWSPDHRHVYFMRPEAKGAAIWRVPVSGGAPEKTGIFFDGAVRGPQVHPDGNRLAFTGTQTDPREVWVLENFLPSAGAKK